MKNYYIQVFVFFMVIFSINNLNSQNHLRILDPLNPWNYYESNIDEMVIDVKPSGNYFQVELYLTFSTTDFSSNNLEIDMDFELPPNSIINDSWLYIENYISHGIVLDKWEATHIYEDIVERRQDPSILIKNSNTSYNIKIYPMDGDSSRSIKLFYLVEADWIEGKISMPLPNQIATLSDDWIDQVVVNVYDDDQFQFDSLKGVNSEPTQEQNEYGENYKQFILSYEQSYYPLFLEYDLGDNGGLFFSSRNFSGEGFYQMSLVPEELFSLDNSRRLLFIIDQESLYSDLDMDYLLDQINLAASTQLHDEDYFNVVYSQFGTELLSQDWIQATQANIDDYLGGELKDKLLDTYSNLPLLLKEGFEFIQMNEGFGEILLFTSNSSFNHKSQAEALLSSVESYLVSDNIPVNIFDFQNKNWHYVFINNQYLYGNEYLYLLLADLTGGEFHRIESESNLLQEIKYFIPGDGIKLDVHSLHIGFNNGLSFEHINNLVGSKIGYTDVLSQVGKYTGTFPVNIEFSAFYKDSLLFYNFTIPENGTNHLYKTDQIWAGSRINIDEKVAEDVVSVKKLIDLSKDFRTLSEFTAFLCLEASQQDLIGQPNETQTTSVEPIIPIEEKLFKVFPNPFENELNIELTNTILNEGGDYFIEIFDSMGRRVWSKYDKRTNNNLLISWSGNGKDGKELEAGIYFIKLSVDSRHQLIKVIKL